MKSDGDYETTGAFQAQSHEDLLDEAAMRDQDQQLQLDRAPKVPRGESIAALPALAQRKGSLLGATAAIAYAAYDADGNPTVDTPDNFAAPAASEADRSEAEADRAETNAAIAEEFNQGISYASQAAGEAATSEGQFFRVPVGTTPETYTRYQRTAGGSVVAAPLATTADLDSTDSDKGAALVRLQQGGNVAQAVKWITPEMFDAVGDGTTADDTTAIQDTFDAADANGYSVRFDAGKRYKITDTVTLQDGNDLDMNGSELFYAGPRDRPALVIGSTAANNYADLRNLSVRSSVTDWTDPDYVGLRLINLQRSNISIRAVVGFTVGLDCYSEGSYFAYNKVTIGALADCQILQRLITVGPSSVAFVNENTFIGGNFMQTGAVSGFGDAYGVVITWDKVSSYRGQNSNVWIRPSFELGYPSAGGSARDCVLFDGAGLSCRFIEARREFSGRAMVIHSDSSFFGTNNTFSTSYNESNQSVSPIAYTGTRGSANTFLGSTPSEQVNPTWSSGDLINYFSSGGAANSFHVAEPFHVCSSANGNPVEIFTSSNLDLDFDAVNSNGFSSSFGFFLDTATVKEFILRTALVDNRACRIVVRCFDANGALLNDSSLTSRYANGIINAWTTSFGGGYNVSSDVFKAGSIRFLDAVKSVQIILAGGTNPARIQAVSVEALNSEQPPRVYSGLARQPGKRKATAKPDIAGTMGRYSQGDEVGNAGAAAASPAGWVATNSGRLARAWLASTAYVVGQVRENGGNIYRCVTAGTSAGSGGPTGTGTAIADGSVVWNYVSPKSTFATMANLA